MSRQVGSRRGMGVLPGFIALALLIAAGMLAAGPGDAAAKWTQPTCGKVKRQITKSKRQVRQAKGAKKSAARARLNAAKKRLKRCLNNRKAYAVIRNGNYESVDDSGPVYRTVNEIFCANGRFYDSWKWYRKGWKVTNSRFRNRKNFAAVVEGLIARKRMLDGTPYLQTFRIALTRKGSEWTRGTVSFNDLSTIYNERPATRKPACG